MWGQSLVFSSFYQRSDLPKNQSLRGAEGFLRMINLTKNLLLDHSIPTNAKLQVPDNEVFNYPEKVLQFGTGVLLRGLPDYFIDNANRQGIFQGRILVVKSTSGSAKAFEAQNGLYTLAVQGLKYGKIVNKYIINSAISRVVSANDHWAEILKSAQNPDIQVVISNTTEVGIQYTEESIYQTPPTSFPAKLTAWLYERFQKLGENSPFTVIVPTELISENGKQLSEIVRRLARFNHLSTDFLTWLAQKTVFCNSLVDRIVTGMPEAETAQAMYAELGYEDNLLTVTEPYKLWAIEGDARVREVLSFVQVDESVVIDTDISYYRERKLRILNGSHTISVCKGYLQGLNTVLECMQDSAMSLFFNQVIHEEIVPTIPGAIPYKIQTFANETLDRFRNPFLKHWLLNITLQGTSKMKMRNVPTMLRYYEKFGEIPEKMTEGFAYYLLFMCGNKGEDSKYYGLRKGEKYLINDESAAYFAEMWQKVEQGNESSLKTFVQEVCQNISLWGENLTKMSGFVEKIVAVLQDKV
ncbi:MAG: tagaturonate reductase [Microscillaceae bacterium]|nr:tagaturonate reductase [Microscillaceae bacterium]